MQQAMLLHDAFVPFFSSKTFFFISCKRISCQMVNDIPLDCQINRLCFKTIIYFVKLLENFVNSTIVHTSNKPFEHACKKIYSFIENQNPLQIEQKKYFGIYNKKKTKKYKKKTKNKKKKVRFNQKNVMSPPL